MPIDIQYGLLGVKTYRAWCNMIARCKSPSHKRYKEYGGRGIQVDKRWQMSFMQFYLDMGNPPSAKHQIDRIDNNKGYSKENCRWVTIQQNVHNSRVVKLKREDVFDIRSLLICGMSCSEIAKIYKISSGNIHAIKSNKTGLGYKKIASPGENGVKVHP